MGSGTRYKKRQRREAFKLARIEEERRRISEAFEANRKFYRERNQRGKLDRAYGKHFALVYTDEKNRQIISAWESEEKRWAFMNRLNRENEFKARTVYYPELEALDVDEDDAIDISKFFGLTLP